MSLTPVRRALTQKLLPDREVTNSVGSDSDLHSRPRDSKRRSGGSQTLPCIRVTWALQRLQEKRMLEVWLLLSTVRNNTT